MNNVMMKDVTKYILEYPSHPILDNNDAMIELVEWENGEGVDITITDEHHTQFISLGFNDCDALRKILEYFLQG